MAARAPALIVAAAVALALVIGAPSPAAAAKKKVVRAGVAKSRTVKKAPKKRTAKRAPAPTAGQRDVRAVLKWLKQHLAETKKSGKPSDLATELLAGLFQLAIPNLVHGHYALAGTGQALRHGGMPKRDVAIVAADMARNFTSLSAIFTNLAARKALRGQVASVFSTLAKLAAHGKLAADAMGGYAKNPNDQAAASTFEAALETYRNALSGLLKQMK